MISVKRGLSVAIALGATVVIGGSAVVATASASSTGSNGTSTNLRFLQRTTDLVILPGPGQKNPNDPPTPGAQSVINYELLKGGKKVGKTSLTCIADSHHHFLCSGVYSLPGGEIAVSEVVPENDPYNAPGAITGGTGKYRHVSGQIQTTPVNEQYANLVFQFD
jgi:hypothetical protein